MANIAILSNACTIIQRQDTHSKYEASHSNSSSHNHPDGESILSNEIIAAIVGGTIGVCASYFGAKVVASLTRRYEAIAKFRSALAPALAKLRFTTKDNLPDLRLFLKSEHLKHAAALEEIRPFARNNIAFANAEDRYKQQLEKFSFASANESLGEEMTMWCIKIVHAGGEAAFIAETVSVMTTLVQCVDHDD